MGTIVAPPRRSCPTRPRASKSTHTMRPKCLILLAAAAMVVISPSVSAAKSDKQPFLMNATTPLAVSTAYRGVEDVKSLPWRGDEVTLLVNTTSPGDYSGQRSPSFALKIGPTLRNFSIELSEENTNYAPHRLPQNTGSWPYSLNHLSLRFSSKLFNGTFELAYSSGNSQFNVCVRDDSLFDYLIRGSKPYRNATESTAGTDLAPGDDRMRSGSNIKWRAGDGDARKRGHFPVTVEVMMRIWGEFDSYEEVTVTAPKLFSFAAHAHMGKPWLNAAGLQMMRDATPECNVGNFAEPGMQSQSNWLKEEFGMDDVRCEHDPACLL